MEGVEWEVCDEWVCTNFLNLFNISTIKSQNLCDFIVTFSYIQ